MAVLVTRRRKVVSATDGLFAAVEKQGYCPQHPNLPVSRSKELLSIVAPSSQHAYTTIVRIGLARFLRCRQTVEIQEELARECHIEVSDTTVRYLARKFLAYIQVVHQQSIPLLKADMSLRGGYILHVDGSCDGGSGVLLVAVDSLSGQVLESQKIASENHAEVKLVLSKVRHDWGLPLAVVHDLRHALITAAAELFPEVPQFVCHYHLAADVGKDILQSHADQLRCLFRRTKVRANLRALIRSLKCFAPSDYSAEHMVTSIIQSRSTKDLYRHCTPQAVDAAVHALASWILSFGVDSGGLDFPFSMPYLNLYARILSVHRAIYPLINCGSSTSKNAPMASLARLIQILQPIISGTEAPQCRQIVARAQRDLRIFERFRSALRIRHETSRNQDSRTTRFLNPARHKAVLEHLRDSLEVKSHRPAAPAKACSIVVKHLTKYWPYLFGHVCESGSSTIVVPRTNNFEENLFGIVKRQCRRLRGSANLSRDIQDMSPSTPLVLNLTNASYCETVYGGRDIDSIALRFASVHPTSVADILTSWRRTKISNQIPRKLAKMPTLPNRLARFLSIAANHL